jgi:hypothetical protein
MADYVVNRKMGNDNVITAERHDTDVLLLLMKMTAFWDPIAPPLP